MPKISKDHTHEANKRRYERMMECANNLQRILDYNVERNQQEIDKLDIKIPASGSSSQQV